MAIERWEVSVLGKVQGVGFRYHTRRTARDLGLTGWVQNQEDGSVNLCAEGKVETLEKLLEWCHRGPATAAVSNVVVNKREPIEQISFDKFTIR